MRESNIYPNKVTRENRKNEDENLLEERIAKKMAELMKDMNPQRQKYDISQAR